MQAKLLSTPTGIAPGASKGSRIWGIWTAILLSTFCLQLLTLDVLPSLQQDEAQITDYGRLSLNPHSDWSITWLIGKEKPLLLWTYLGPLISEAAFRLDGGSGIGPRIAGIIGGLFAATMCLLWLQSRKVPQKVSVLLSLTLLFDPLFNLSQRMARVDSWVIGLCLCACYLLRSRRSGFYHTNRLKLIAAGALTATASFVWPSAIFLYPLILVEFVAASIRNTDNLKHQRIIRDLLLFLASAIVMAIVLVIPIRSSIMTIFADTNEMISLNVNSQDSPWRSLTGLFDLQKWIKLVKGFVKTFSPFLPLFAIVGAVYRRDKPLILATMAVLFIIFGSLVYEFRLLYLLPYFVALASGFWLPTDRAADPSITPKRSGQIARSALLGLLVWAAFVTLVLRTTLGYLAKPQLSRLKLLATAETVIGTGNYKVFLPDSYEFYFVGRHLGWRLYIPYIMFRYDKQGNWYRINEYQPEDKFLKLLSQMDYAIFPVGSVSSGLSNQLEESGLMLERIIPAAKAEKGSPDGMNHHLQILSWFLRGKDNYGSFRVYGRSQANRNMREPLRKNRFASSSFSTPHGRSRD